MMKKHHQIQALTCLLSISVFLMLGTESIFATCPPGTRGGDISKTTPDCGYDVPAGQSNILNLLGTFNAKRPNSNFLSNKEFVPPGQINSTVNGICGSTNNSCTAGTLSDTPDNATNYLWDCLGSNGGSSANCSLPSCTPVDCSYGPPTSCAGGELTTTQSCTNPPASCGGLDYPPQTTTCTCIEGVVCDSATYKCTMTVSNCPYTLSKVRWTMNGIPQDGVAQNPTKTGTETSPNCNGKLTCSCSATACYYGPYTFFGYATDSATNAENYGRANLSYGIY